MSRKARYFVIVSHCLLNPAARVHMLGRRFMLAKIVCDFMLSKHICVIQLPCPEFTAMGYWRNPQGRQQYDNVFFRKHCREQLESYVDMVQELIENDNTLLCYIGIQGSPTCSICWGKHKQNKYKTESMMPADEAPHCDSFPDHDYNCNTSHEYDTSYDCNSNSDSDHKSGPCSDGSFASDLEHASTHPPKESGYGVMTAVLDQMLKERGIQVPYLEAPVKESLESDKAHHFFQELNALLAPAHPHHASHCSCHPDHAPSSVQFPDTAHDHNSSCTCNSPTDS